MKTCPTCFKNNRPGREGFRQPKTSETGNFGDQPARSKSRYPERPNTSREPLKNDDGFDDIPF